MHLTSHITNSNGYAPYIAYYRSNGFNQRFRKLKPKPKLNPPNAHRSQIKICEKWHTHNVQFRFMPNAFRILKPIQKSSKRVWVFRNTGANAFAKNQMRLAYEDKRDLYCMGTLSIHWKKIGFDKSKVKVTGTVHWFLKVQSYLNNWGIENYQYLFVDTSLYALSTETIKKLSEQRNDVTKIRQYLTFNM